MNKREFIKVVAAGAALAVLPPVFGRPASSAPVLADWIDTYFKTAVGAPWAFVEPRPAAYEERVDDVQTWLTDRDYKGLTPYHTYVVEADNEAAAVAEFQQLLASLVAAHPQIKGTPLWWRFPYRISVEPRNWVETGVIIVSAERIEDSRAHRPRLGGDALTGDELSAIFEMHPDAEFDDTGNFRKPDVVVQRVRLRTRIAVPALQALGEQPNESYATSLWGHSTTMVVETEPAQA